MADLLVDLMTLTLKIAIGLALAFVSIYLGMWILKLIMKVRNKMKLNIRGNLMVGNNAMALLVGSMTIGIAMIAEAGLARMLVGTEFGADYMRLVLLAELQVLLGILLATVLISISLILADKMFRNVDLLMEVRDGNVAMSAVMSVIILLVCYFGRAAAVSLGSILV